MICFDDPQGRRFMLRAAAIIVRDGSVLLHRLVGIQGARRSAAATGLLGQGTRRPSNGASGRRRIAASIQFRKSSMNSTRLQIDFISVPAAGADAAEYLIAKYGMNPQHLAEGRRRIAERGAAPVGAVLTPSCPCAALYP